MNKTTEALEKTAKSSVAVAGSSIDWFTEHMLQPTGNESALQGMSTGRMQGFVSDCPFPVGAQAAPVPADSPKSYHGEMAPEPRHALAGDSSAPAAAAATPSAAAGVSSAKAKADLWSDEAWDDWN